ncbi:MAG: HAD family hydrolase [Candidatus Thorarchaeota archaeon]
MHSLDISEFEAVIFDLDSTLTDTHRYPIIATEWLLVKSGVTSEQEIASYVRHLVTRYREAIQAIVEGAPFRSPFDIIRTAMEQSLEDFNLNTDQKIVDEATQRFKSLHIELSTVYSGVTELLDSLLGKGKALGVISNSFIGHANIILKKLELDHYFSSVIDCGDVQGFKPMSSLFLRVARDLDVEASKSIYVGDEYYADMVGAKGVGMTTIWINKWERSLSDLVDKHGAETTPDFVLDSVSEMNKML